MAATGRKPTLRSSRLGILICLRLRANQNVGEHQLSLAPCREHRVGRHLFDEHVADRGPQGVGDMRIMLGPDASFEIAGDRSRDLPAETRGLVAFLRLCGVCGPLVTPLLDSRLAGWSASDCVV